MGCGSHRRAASGCCNLSPQYGGGGLGGRAWQVPQSIIPPREREGKKHALHFRIGAGIGGPAGVDRLLLVESDLRGYVVPLAGRCIEDRFWIVTRPELGDRLAQHLLVLVSLQQR